jgi:thiol-disulfide isomerase/thioredoxin
MDAQPVRLDLVMAEWCPHCYPLSIDQAKLASQALGVPVRILDIDQPDQERIADELVRLHGDWTDDYLIPQVFLQWSDGTVQHLLTGIPGSVEQTRRSWERVRAHLPPAPDPR